MVTIQDVARLAQVSISSVSNVLNGRAGKMRPETYARVQAAIKTLGYRPNQAARQLKTGRISVIGLLVPSTANPFLGKFAHTMEMLAQNEYGFRVLLCNTNRDPELESRMFDDLLGFGVSSAIVVSSLADPGYLLRAVEKGLNIVSYDRGTENHGECLFDHVSPDNVAAGRIAAEHLMQHGHRHIAFVMPEGLTVSRRDKIKGMQHAVQQAGSNYHLSVIESRPQRMYGDSEMAEIGYDTVRALKTKTDRPTGIVAVNDMMAIGLMAGLREHGISVPKDMSVIGMDNTTIAAFAYPGLSSVAMPVDEMARLMVERAVLRTRQVEVEPICTLHKPELVARQSVALSPTLQ